MDIIKDIKNNYCIKRKEINSRLEEFKRIFASGSEKDVFTELVFCILTPQSKAKYCWDAVNKLLNKNLLLKGAYRQVLKELNYTRFKYKKAKFIIGARKLFFVSGKIIIKQRIKQFKNVDDAREWLVDNVKGIGFKEASHFLRNIGLGDNLAILDRHILKNLKLFGVIKEIPGSLTKRKYYEIEDKIRKFSRKIDIPVNSLDLLLWYKETGEIFK